MPADGEDGMMTPSPCPKPQSQPGSGRYALALGMAKGLEPEDPWLNF